MTPVQLSLMPDTGWAIMGPGGELEENDDTGEPMLFDELSAHRYARRFHFPTRVVRVERHPAVEGANGLPTYVVL
jgi:hypothetical protein